MERRLIDQIEGNSSNNRTVIGGKTKIVGTIAGDHDLIFKGDFEGEVQLNSLLLLEKEGKMKGNIKVENMIIEGKVEGDIEAKGKVEIRSNGYFQGNVVCQTIAIEEGAFFQGNIRMEDGRKIVPTYFKEKRKDLQSE